MADSTVIGVVTMARHGDRSGFYQDPTSYSATGTVVTPLGVDQAFSQGQYLRQQYLTAGSSSAIASLASASVFNQTQYAFSADAGGEGGVIFDSCVALAQGLFPATGAENTTLANGTTVTSPLGGYQYVPIESVEPNEDVTLEGFTSCPAFTAANNAVYNSSEFKTEAQQVQPQLASLQPLVGNQRQLSLSNGYNIYDFVHVQSIHNATFLNESTPAQLDFAFWLGNWHEQQIFSSPNASAIDNIAWNAMAPRVIAGLNSAANSSSPVKWTHIQISYKPFISFWSVAQVPGLQGLINYAGYQALELRQPSSGGEPVVRLMFRNGTENGPAVQVNMLGNNGDTPLSQFMSVIGNSSLNSLGQWCTACNQTSLRGCGVLNTINMTNAELAVAQANANGSGLSLAGAGGIGAGVTLTVVIVLLSLLAATGLVTFGKKRQHHRSISSDAGSDHALTEK